MHEKVLAVIDYILAKGGAAFTGPFSKAVWVEFAKIVQRYREEIALAATVAGGDVIAAIIKVGNDAVAALKTPRIMGVEIDDWLWMALIRPWLQSLIGIDPELNRLVALAKAETEAAHE